MANKKGKAGKSHAPSKFFIPLLLRLTKGQVVVVLPPLVRHHSFLWQKRQTIQAMLTKLTILRGFRNNSGHAKVGWKFPLGTIPSMNAEGKEGNI
jgi:hypothetical protein